MNRTGLVVALAIAAVVGLVFGLFPALDVRISALFLHIDEYPWLPFGLRIDPFLMDVRDGALWFEAAIAAVPAIALIAKILVPRARMLLPGRACIFLLSTMALAPGLFVNTLVKDNWGRPRPIDIPQFGGDEPFVPWWDPRGVCPKNCSFVAGDPSGAFWTLAPAVLAPPAWRGIATAAALTFGAAIGVLRISAGAHFFSDVVFSGVFTFLIIWIVHGLIYRWPRTRFSDAAVARAIERVMLPVYAFLGAPIRRLARMRRRDAQRAPAE